MDRWPKGLLVDLDDTVLAFEPVSNVSWEETIGEYQAEFGAVSLNGVVEAIRAAAKAYWGDPARHRTGRLDLVQARKTIVREAARSMNLNLGDKVISQIAMRYEEVRMQRIYPIEGAIDCLIQLRRRGIRLGLLTNGSIQTQQEKIRRFDLSPYFDSVCIEQVCGVGKPDPKSYRCALDKLDLPATDVWMVGDNLEWDVLAPQRMGMHGIWVDYRNQGLPTGSPRPHRIIGSLAQLIE